MKHLITLTIVLSSTLFYSQDYVTLKNSIKHERNLIYSAFNKADSIEKTIIIQNTRSYLNTIMVEKMFPAWYGTKWGFNGITSTPRQGEIACGYFITTTLQDVGFDIPRYYWAQQYGSYYIKKLCPENGIKNFSNAEMEKIKLSLLQKGDGLYVVGLDNHVGYIYVSGNEFKFIHSNYYPDSDYVCSENISASPAFKSSSTHMIGKLFSDEMITNWILNTHYQK